MIAGFCLVLVRQGPVPPLALTKTLASPREDARLHKNQTGALGRSL